jgi:hypothetical protein
MLFLGRVKAQKQREKLGNIETQFLDELVLPRFIGGATNSFVSRFNELGAQEFVTTLSPFHACSHIDER